MLPKNREPTHPGQVLLHEFLEPMELTQKEFAAHIKWTYAKLNEIINCKRGITPKSAIDLSEALGMSPEFWLNLQTNYDLWKEKKSRTKRPAKQRIRKIKPSKKVVNF